jgi:ubiquitin-like protein Pup
MAQKQVRKLRTRVTMNTRTEVIDEDQTTRSEKERAALKDELDDLLDEVDEVLDGNEEFRNAQEFIDGYVQKSGE